MTTPLDTLPHEDSNLTPDTLARVALSVIVEPMDDEAGALVLAHGAESALEMILTGKGSSELLHSRARPRFTDGAVTMALRMAARFGATLITPEHKHWPTRMNDLGQNAPFALWVRGDSSLLIDSRITAIVGARAATGYGEHITMELAAGLVDRGHTVASGAAYGIDGMAHRAALASKGRTIAFLAGGVDRFYPSGHDALLSRIVECGAVVSELPCGASPTKWRFLARNRLIAAGSDATVLTEAGWRSGSLNTAGHAFTLGRPVGAVPGPVTSAASAGTHRLIRELGATLVTNADDVAALVISDADTAPAA